MPKAVQTIGWVALIVALACASCRTSVAGSVTGTATYRERIALPREAIFDARIVDVAGTGGAPTAIAATTVKAPKTPIRFVLTVEDKALRPDARYVVRGRISVDGEVWFAGEAALPPPGAGGARHVALLLRRVAGDTGDISLEATHWKLRTLHGVAVKPVAPAQEAWLTLDPAAHRVSGFGGCNHVTGDYALDGERLTFSHMAATLRMCLHGMEQEDAFLKALRTVARWQVSGSRLALLDTNGVVAATFAAGAMP